LSQQVGDSPHHALNSFFIGSYLQIPGATVLPYPHLLIKRISMTPSKVKIKYSDPIDFASFDYRKFLKDSGLIGSMSPKGECLDNAVAESFFGTLKTEWVITEPSKKRNKVCLNTLRYFTIDSADILIWAI
jgi:transposase InsO family protein